MHPSTMDFFCGDCMKDRNFVTQTTSRLGGVTSQLEPSGKSWTTYWCVSALLVVMVLFAFVRVRLRDMPLERDEGEYAYVGQLMLQGIPPYKVAGNMKLPGTYAAYALIMAACGQTIAGIHLGLLVVNAASIVLVYLLGKKLFTVSTGLAACATFALLSVGGGV